MSRRALAAAVLAAVLAVVPGFAPPPAAVADPTASAGAVLLGLRYDPGLGTPGPQEITAFGGFEAGSVECRSASGSLRLSFTGVPYYLSFSGFSGSGTGQSVHEDAAAGIGAVSFSGGEGWAIVGAVPDDAVVDPLQTAYLDEVSAEVEYVRGGATMVLVVRITSIRVHAFGLHAARRCDPITLVSAGSVVPVGTSLDSSTLWTYTGGAAPGV